jgi:hypothetical protein
MQLDLSVETKGGKQGAVVSVSEHLRRGRPPSPTAASSHLPDRLCGHTDTHAGALAQWSSAQLTRAASSQTSRKSNRPDLQGGAQRRRVSGARHTLPPHTHTHTHAHTHMHTTTTHTFTFAHHTPHEHTHPLLPCRKLLLPWCKAQRVRCPAARRGALLRRPLDPHNRRRFSLSVLLGCQGKIDDF